jgi:hypothetical protein
LANAGIYNAARGALQLHGRKGGGAVRRRKSHSPPRGAKASLHALGAIPESCDDEA